jgi:muramoyltetrapeptide carboxypeptidase
MNLHLIAPSGSLPDTSVLVNGEAWFKQKNISVANLECGRRQFQRFAGSDHERLKEINDLALISPNQVVMALRGGYGLSRLLGQINWNDIAQQVNQGLKIVGHSDFTAFCLALFAKTGAPSFAGPMFSYDFCGDVSEFTWKHFHEAMTKEIIEIEVIAPQIMAKPLGVSDAVLWGGNLTMLTSLLGTEYLPSKAQVKGGILFVEDVNEHPYRIERMLQQLMDAGYLSQQKAVILGDISSYRLSDVDRGYDLNAAVDAIRQRLGDSVPVLTGLPFGHCPDKLTLPVGRTASLSASSSGYILRANCA